ncbi:MAG TPA: HigA family addiction module antitoxin [Thermoanaerobaculia bacterium]|jgi:addiction module HigA family antidote
MHSPCHPGEILREDYLKPLGLSVSDVAKGLGVARKTLSVIVNERARISSPMAYRLARAFGTSPEFWVNLQTQYDLWQAGQEVDLGSVAVFSPPAA